MTNFSLLCDFSPSLFSSVFGARTLGLWIPGQKRHWIPGQKRHWIPGQWIPGTFDSQVNFTIPETGSMIYDFAFWSAKPSWDSNVQESKVLESNVLAPKNTLKVAILNFSVVLWLGQAPIRLVSAKMLGLTDDNPFAAPTTKLIAFAELIQKKLLIN